MFTRKIASALIASTVAAGSLVGTVQPSAAGGHHHIEPGVDHKQGAGGRG